MVRVVAWDVAQVSLAGEPEVTLVGLAEKDVIVGMDCCGGVVVPLLTLAQPARRKTANEPRARNRRMGLTARKFTGGTPHDSGKCSGREIKKATGRKSRR